MIFFPQLQENFVIKSLYCSIKPQFIILIFPDGALFLQVSQFTIIFTPDLICMNSELPSFLGDACVKNIPDAYTTTALENEVRLKLAKPSFARTG